MKYNNNEYEALIHVLMNEAFYMESLSYDTKIAQIRKYTEIIVRRLLKYPCDKLLTLGHYTVQNKLEKGGFTESLLSESLSTINANGSHRTHTQKTILATREEYEECVNSLFNLYGYLFYKYFQKYSFGYNEQVMSAFSILPPIIRHITLNELFIADPSNPVIIDKLVLAKLKVFDDLTTIEWIEANKEHLEQIQSSVSENQRLQFENQFGKEMAAAIIESLQKNMYEISKEKVLSISRTPSIIKYKTFEEALAYYRDYGILSGNSADVIEFNDLMEFVYLGRKECEKEIADIPEDQYVINKMIWVLNPKE